MKKKGPKKHYRSMHWTHATSGEAKAKMGFQTLDEALHFARVNKLDLSPYVCDVCGCWHLGHYRERETERMR